MKPRVYEGPKRDGSGPRYLVVNADDFGLTTGVNRGIIEAHERGVVTSASLMVRHPAAEDAVAHARAHPRLSVGLHFDIEEWRHDGQQWVRAYQVVRRDNAAAVRKEFERQLATFERLVGRPPTHLDSHQHVHLPEPARSVLLKYAEQLGVPLRNCTPDIAYCGSFYGQNDEGQTYPRGISIAAFVEIIEELPPGWTELGCHPGYPEGLDSVYSTEREEELRVLRSVEVVVALQHAEVKLRSFLDFKNRARAL